ncbi:MAG: SipW-dependent-type signal peptide-containing protein [Clostridium sp.]|nr:SipW-dependent-type signal peptide-containing protein [Clostridium sp.]
MKKTKMILATAVLTAGLLGTGYAYWTDSLSVGGTISTGRLDVNITEVSKAALPEGSEIGNADKFNESAENNNGFSISKSDDKVTFNISNIHPGAEPVISFKFKNEGTISAKLLSEYNISSIQTGNLAAFNFKVATSEAGLETATVANGDAQIKRAFFNLLSNGLKPGEEIELFVKVSVNENYADQGMDKKVAYTLTFPWNQYNK